MYLLHFVAFFRVASVLSIGVDNRTVGADNRKMGVDMDFLIDGQISSFCPDQHEATIMGPDECFS